MSALTLAIDTSCDDTTAAITCGLEVWSNVISSQVELHKPYGGVFPTVAKLAHKENIEKVVLAALQRGHVKLENIDQIAVTIGPGLAPALEVGIAYAQQLAAALGKPLISVNHIEGHLLSSHALARPTGKWQELAKEKQRSEQRTREHWQSVKLPALGLIVSGRQTMFVLVEKNEKSLSNIGSKLSKLDRKPNLKLINASDDLPWLNSGRFCYTVLGQSIDDAAGEALDKIGRMLNLGYPAGPVIEELAKHGNPHRYQLPLPMTETQNFNLSFSGLKTHTRNLLETKWGSKPLNKQETYDLCASVQYAIFRHICYKLSKLIKSEPAYNNIDRIWLGGGVAANITLHKMVRKIIPVLVPYRKTLCGDNAAMIGL